MINKNIVKSLRDEINYKSHVQTYIKFILFVTFNIIMEFLNLITIFAKTMASHFSDDLWLWTNFSSSLLVNVTFQPDK